MKTLLDGIRDHLQDAWAYVEVGRKPDGVPDNLPYATVWLTNAQPDGNTATPGDIDLEQEAIVHIKSIGSSFDQAGLLADDLDTKIRDGLAIDGLAIQLVIRDRQAGPTRDDDVYPAPHSIYADRWYRIQFAPDVGS